MVEELYNTTQCKDYRCTIYVDKVVDIGGNSTVIDLAQNITEELWFFVNITDSLVNGKTMLLHGNYTAHATAQLMSKSSKNLYLTPDSKETISATAT